MNFHRPTGVAIPCPAQGSSFSTINLTRAFAIAFELVFTSVPLGKVLLSEPVMLRHSTDSATVSEGGVLESRPSFEGFRVRSPYEPRPVDDVRTGAHASLSLWAEIH